MKRVPYGLAVLALLLVAAPVLADEGLQAPDPDGEWEACNLKFSLLRSTDLVVGGPMQVGMKIELPSPSGGFAVQPDGGDVKVDLTGDGNFNGKAKDGKPVFFQVQREDGKTTPYAVRFMRGARMAWTYETATSMAGKVGGEKFSLVDANCNGVFNEIGKDAVLVGRAKWAVPLGSLIVLKGNLYHLIVEASGEEVKIQPYAGKTGTLDLTDNFRAPASLTYAVVQSGETYFNIASRGGETVPAGKYTFVSGRLEKGRKSCGIVRGSWKEIEVAADGKSSPEWGPELKIEFKATLNEEKVHLDATLRIFGKAGEEYKDFAPNIMTPDITVKSKEGLTALSGRFATG